MNTGVLKLTNEYTKWFCVIHTNSRDYQLKPEKGDEEEQPDVRIGRGA
jgi:hypothetical protein